MDDNLFVVLNNKVIASWHIVRLFHEVASRGVKPTQENVKLRARGLLNELDPLTKQFSSRLEPDYENQIAEEIASSAALTAESVISATSIVLAHAVLDDLVSELCLSSSKLEPELWVDAIEAKKIDFKCAAERPLTEIRQELIEAYVNQLCREAIVKRTDALHKRYTQQSSSSYRNGVEYKFDRDRLSTLDRFRQDALHRVEFPQRNADELRQNLEFLENTCFYLINLVTWRHYHGLYPGFVNTLDLQNTESARYGINFDKLLLASSLSGEMSGPTNVHLWRGQYFVSDQSGTQSPLPIATPVAMPSYSEDGNKVTYVRYRRRDEKDPPRDYNQTTIGDLAVAASDGTDEQILLKEGSYEELKDIEGLEPFSGSITGIQQPNFSVDGAEIFFIGSAWQTSGAVYALNITQNRLRFILDGNAIVIVKGGSYRGSLLINRHRYYEAPNYGSYDHYWLVTTDGTVIRQFGESWSEALLTLSAE